MILKYLSGRFRSIGYAVNGAVILIKTQPNARIHLAATLVAITGGCILGLHEGEWLATLLCIGLVWTAEALNTGLEHLADEVDPNHRPGIGKAKDVAAAGVLIAALVSVTIAGVILYHHL
jgi:diacylglycerol kinase (ATP)